MYGENYDEENENAAHGKGNAAARKRKVASEDALNKCAYYDWPKLADDGKVILELCCLLKRYLKSLIG